MKTLILPTAIALFGLVSCKKESTSAVNTSTFQYRVSTINRTAVVGRSASNLRTESTNVQWASGKASANLLKFEAESATGEVEFKQNTKQQIDLFASTSTLGSLSVPAGTYSEVEFKAFLAPTSASPALELAGTFTSGGATKAIRFVVSSQVELKAEKKNVTVAQGTTYSALNTVDLSQLTRNVTEAALNNATPTNGEIVLSASSNTTLYNIMLQNLNKHHSEAEVEHD